MGYPPDWGKRKLKEQIALGNYRVDSRAVADEILRKLSLIKQARREILTRPVDRTPRFDARGHDDL